MRDAPYLRRITLRMPDQGSMINVPHTLYMMFEYLHRGCSDKKDEKKSQKYIDHTKDNLLLLLLIIAVHKNGEI